MTAGRWKNSRTRETKKKRKFADERRFRRRLMYGEIRTVKMIHNQKLMLGKTSIIRRKVECRAIRKQDYYRMCKKKRAGK